MKAFWLSCGKRFGAKVTTVTALSDPAAALDVVKQIEFAIFLTDQQMPQLTGLEFLAQARLIQPDATRILITGILNLNTIIDSINTGEIYRFIVKPWLHEELLVTIKNAHQRFEMLRHNQELHAETQVVNKALAAQVAKVAEQNQLLENLTPPCTGTSINPCSFA